MRGACRGEPLLASCRADAGCPANPMGPPATGVSCAAESYGPGVSVSMAVSRGVVLAQLGHDLLVFNTSALSPTTGAMPSSSSGSARLREGLKHVLSQDLATLAPE